MIGIGTWVLKAVPGDCKSSKAHVVIEPSTYNRVWKEIDRGENMVIVGWYHTHPNLGIFLSATDMRNMELYHYKPYQIAVVIDPIQNLFGIFVWQNGELKCLKGDYLIPFEVDYREYFEGRKHERFSWEGEGVVLKEVYLSKEAAETMLEHAYQSSEEVGGLLVGKPSIIKNER